MQSELINKIAITLSNISDAVALRHICLSQGAVFADKGYCTKSVKFNNMKDKNNDLDKWPIKIGSPFERGFSKRNKRVRYLGIDKNQFAKFMNVFSIVIYPMITYA